MTPTPLHPGESFERARIREDIAQAAAEREAEAERAEARRQRAAARQQEAARVPEPTAPPPLPEPAKRPSWRSLTNPHEYSNRRTA